jgi:hypothetical protein
MFGRITYKDIFGNLHYTQFCGYNEFDTGNFIQVGNLNIAN